MGTQSFETHRGNPDLLRLPDEKMRWWRDAKFGMFLHWGIYSVLGRGEWLMFNERIPVGEYRKMAEKFQPTKFDADAWVDTAKKAGMKYMVMVARHHDGFCLFDSQVSDFTSTKLTGGRDYVRDYVEACRRGGLGVGLYYSPLDWRFPGYFFPNLYRESAEAMKQQTYDQVRELLTNYGKIDILWYDGGGDDWLGFGGLEFDSKGWHSRDANWPQEKHYSGPPLWEPEKLNALVRQLQPDIVINNRSGWEGDFYTPECRIGAFDNLRAWETCDVLAKSWGWMPDQPMLSLRSAIQLLVRVIVGDGNLLLNVGPTGEGEIEPRQVNRLEAIGEWLQLYGESIFGTRGGPFPSTNWGGYTYKGNHLFVHILDWPENAIVVPYLDGEVINSRSLTTSDVFVQPVSGGLQLGVPSADRQAIDTIIDIQMDRPIER